MTLSDYFKDRIRNKDAEEVYLEYIQNYTGDLANANPEELCNQLRDIVAEQWKEESLGTPEEFDAWWKLFPFLQYFEDDVDGA